MSGARWNQQTHFFSSLTAVSPFWWWGWGLGSKVCSGEGIFNAAQHRKRKLGDPAEAESQLFICRLWEIVLLTSSSFKAHVHLLHVVIVNQAFRLCAFSQVFHLPCVLALRWTVFRITPPCGNDHASLKSWFGLLNYFNKYQTRNSARSVHFSAASACDPLSSAQRELISHTSANGGVRLFVYLLCLFSDWVSLNE